MIILNIWENKHVPNHQPVIVLEKLYLNNIIHEYIVTNMLIIVDIQFLQSLLQAIVQPIPHAWKRLLHVFPLYSCNQRFNAETETKCAHYSLQEMHVQNELGLCVYLGNIITYNSIISYIVLYVHT